MDGPSPVQMRVDGDVPGLCRAARSGDSRVARQALELLGDIGGPVATEALLGHLERPHERHPWLRLYAIESLGQLRERRAVPALLRILDEPRPDDGGMRTDVLYRALAAIGTPEAVRAVVDGATAPHPSRFVLGALRELRTPEAVIPLLAALWHFVPGGVLPVVRALGGLRDPRTAAALLVVADAEWVGADGRGAAVEALRALPEAAWPPPLAWGHAEHKLTRALVDPDPEIARPAAELLSRTAEGRHQMRGVLRRADRDPRSPMAPPWAVAAVCARMRERPDLFAAPADDSSAPREARDEVRLLIRLLRKAPVPAVRRAAAGTLGALAGAEAVAPLLDALADGQITEAVAKALARLPEPPVQRLLPLLGDADGPAQRLGAVRALGLIGHPEAAPPLLVLLDDEEAPTAVRAAAADALAALRHREAADRLAALAGDEEEPGTLRARAVRALGRIGAPDTLPTVLACADSPQDAVRLRAVAALGGFPVAAAARALGALVAADADRDVTLAAVHALGRMGAPAVPVLAALADHVRGDVASHSVAALAACRGPQVPAALGALIGPEQGELVQMAAARALSERRSPEGVAAMAALLTRPEVYGGCHDVALRGLVAVGTEEALGHVEAYCREAVYLTRDVRRAVTAVAASRARKK